MSNQQVEEEIEELPVTEKTPDLSTSTLVRDHPPTSTWGLESEPLSNTEGVRPITPVMENAGETPIVTSTTSEVQLEAPPQPSVSEAVDSVPPRPEFPRTREYKAKRRAKRQRQAENRTARRAAESEPSTSQTEPLPPAQITDRALSPQPSTSDVPEIKPILLANPPIVFTRPKATLNFTVRKGGGEPITVANVECALWTYPCNGCIVSIRECLGIEVVVETSTSTAADTARSNLTTEGFSVGPVQKLGIRAHFDCPRNVSHLDPATVLRGVLSQNASIGLRQDSLTYVSVSRTARRKEGGEGYKVRKIFVDVATHAVAILNKSNWKLWTITNTITLRPVGGMEAVRSTNK